MACSLPAGFRTKAVAPATLIASALLASVALKAQDANRYILATRRSGAIEIIDPESLSTISRIHFDLPSKSVGLNGISAGADGQKLYVRGPHSDDVSGGCCEIYSVDLATLETKEVKDATLMESDRQIGLNVSPLNPSPDGRWVFEVRRYSAAIDVFDAVNGKRVRALMAPGLRDEDQWWSTGTWMDDRFLYYARKEDGSAARLWSLSAEATELGEGVSVDAFAKVPGCSSFAGAGLVAAAGNLFLYEPFGWKGDRREYCGGVPGGAWLLDTKSGSLLRQIAPDLYFSELVADREKGELYGLSVGDPDWLNGVELVRIDAQDGSILRSRVLESDFWSISFGSLHSIPAGDVRALISVKK
jgi:hypothetical protein